MEKNILFSQEDKIEKFDKTDAKIIQLLNTNSRLSFQEIGKIVYKSKEGVRARIRSLEKREIILGYPSIINFEKINIQRYLFKIYLKGSITEKEDYIEKIKRHKDLISLSEVLNEVQFLFFIKDYEHLNEVISEIAKNDCIAKFEFSKLIKYHYSPPVLFDLHNDEKFRKHISNLNKEKKKEKLVIDKTDFKILKILSENSNIKISEISERLKIQRDTIKYRMNRLINSGIVESFHIYFNIHKLGYITHVLKIAVSERTKMKEIIDYLKNHYLTNGVVELDGSWNLFVPFYSKSIKEVINFEKTFLRKFEENLFDYSIIEFKEQVSVREFPDFED